MKKHFTNPKLKTYSALAGSFLAAGNIADAGIVYTDVNPDVTKIQTTLGASSYAVDMNNDGTIDFNITAAKLSGTTTSGVAYSITGVGVYPTSAYNGVAVSSPGGYYASVLDANTNINSAMNWYAGTSAAVLAAQGAFGGVPFTKGTWANVSDKYVGVKFKNAGSIYYGWIRLTVGNYNTFTIKEFAYESVADQAIQAGQTVATGVQDMLNSITTIKNVNNVIEAEFSSPLSGNMQVVNMNGSVVSSVAFDGKSCNINMQGKPNGVYVVNVITTEGIIGKKVVVE